MDRLELKKQLLKMLSDDMKEESKQDRKKFFEPKAVQKVTVMADSPEGLKKGLSKAEEIMAAREKMKSELPEFMMPEKILKDLEQDELEDSEIESEDESYEDEEMCEKRKKRLF